MTPKPKPKPKYLESEQGGQRERWLISYTDFVTILLILFVAIAAQGMRPAQNSPTPPPQAVPKPAAKPMPPSPTPASETPPETPLETPKDSALVEANQKLQALGLDS